MTNGFVLRSHQAEYIRDLRFKLREYDSVLGQAATGFGKTVVSTFCISSAHNKGHDCIFMVHRRELLKQTSKTFERAGLPHTFIASGHHYNPRMKIAIATVGTLANRLDSIRPPKLFIADEAHHSTATTWARCVDWSAAYKAKRLGFTATPWRLNGEGLKRHFQCMVLGKSVAWLIKHGFLSEYRAFGPPPPDMTQAELHAKNGDFIQQEIESIMSGKAIISDFVGQWQKHAAGLKTIGFAVSVAHSKMLAQAFNASGIRSAHLDADTPTEQRELTIMNYAAGYLDVLWNVGLFSEGFDLSAIAGRDVPIQAVIQGKPTLSLSDHLQQLGRALRPKDTPAVFLDHTGNIMRHGFPDDEREWSLEDREKRKKSEAEEKVKRCPSCYALHPAVYKKCPECGHIYTKPEPTGMGRKIDGSDLELKEITREQINAQQQGIAAKKAPVRPVQMNLPLDGLIAHAYKNGMRAGDAERWAAREFTQRIKQKYGN